MLDRHHLAILREVSRTGSVTAAAERLNLSQSAVSHTIRKLEDRYGIKIWQKQGRGLRLSQAGNYLLELAQRLLPQLEYAERTLRDFAAGRRGALRIGMECHPCQKWLMQVTAPYLTAWPDVDLQVCTDFRFDGIAALSDYEIDILVTPDPIERPELSFTPVFDYELVLAVHQSHPLAAKEYVLPADLTPEELIAFPVSLERLDVYTRFLLPAGCRPRKHSPAETIELMLQLVAAQRGVSVIPDWLLREKGIELPIRALRLGPEGLDKSIFLGTRLDEKDVDYVSGFIAMAGKTGHQTNGLDGRMTEQEPA